MKSAKKRTVHVLENVRLDRSRRNFLGGLTVASVDVI